jgi:hypothetical protein
MAVAALLATSLTLGACGKDEPEKTPERAPERPPATTPGTGPSAGTGTPSATDAIGYADVQAILRGLGKPAKGAPHGTFWDEPYATFVDMEFEHPDEGVMIKVITPWKGADSNLVKALRSGKGITATRDGETVSIDIDRMPNGGPYLDEAEIKKIERWIDQGAPEVAGKASTLPKPR